MADDCFRSLGKFDYVIVGAGPSAIGLLLGLLQPYIDNEDDIQHPPDLTIALLERGTDCQNAHAWTRTLWDWFQASHIRNKSNQIYLGRTVNNSHRHIDVPTGRGLGGSTNINAGLVIPPARSDFAAWPGNIRDNIFDSVGTILNVMNENGCLTYTMPESERIIDSNLPRYSTKRNEGFLNETMFPSVCMEVLCSAGNTKNDRNLHQQEGAKYTRRNYYEGLISPLLDKNPRLKNILQIFTGYTAEKLIISDSTCKGIEVLSNVTGQLCTITAEKEVIVATGSIETPALLLASGIGRKQDLDSQSIPSTVSDGYKGHVGGNLRDHMIFSRVFVRLPRYETRSLNGVRVISNVEVKAKEGHSSRVQILLMDPISHVLSALLAGVIRYFVPESLLINRVLEVMYRSVKVCIYLLISYSPLYFLIQYCISGSLIALVNARSVGKVSVRRKKKSEMVASSPVRRSDLDVEINLSYFSDEADMALTMEAWEGTKNIYPNQGVEIFPGPLVLQGSTIHSNRFSLFARNFVYSYFHYMGTCSMQLETVDEKDEWVVDKNLRVRDVKALRICDASVFPTLISVPPALTCAAIGHLLGTKLARERNK